MPEMVDFQLTNSKGLMRIIYCYGLEAPMLIVPTVHGDPLLTAQHFYYLEDLDSIARLNVDTIAKRTNHDESQMAREAEYLIDNYLFEFSAKHLSAKLSSKVTDHKYWRNTEPIYVGYDNNHTLALALDILNDDAIKVLGATDGLPTAIWTDWCLINNILPMNLFEQYTAAVSKIVHTMLQVQADNHEHLGTGTTSLPIVKLNGNLLTHYQALMLDTIRERDIDISKTSLQVTRGGNYRRSEDFGLIVEFVKAEKLCDPDLLSYYFAGVREYMPISQFRSFYNVLEFFFEEAPRVLSESARSEREQISCVVRWIINESEMRKFICEIGDEYRQVLGADLNTSGGQIISGINLSNPDLLDAIAGWLYTIRCACVHSKLTRRGMTSTRLVPYTIDEDVIQAAVPLIQKLAVECIRKEAASTYP
jgi:hypothetical protein